LEGRELHHESDGDGDDVFQDSPLLRPRQFDLLADRRRVDLIALLLLTVIVETAVHFDAMIIRRSRVRML
jgi:hypothetical protein